MSGKKEAHREVQHEGMNAKLVETNVTFFPSKSSEVESSLLMLDRASGEKLHRTLALGSSLCGNLSLLRTFCSTSAGFHVSSEEGYETVQLRTS